MFVYSIDSIHSETGQRKNFFFTSFEICYLILKVEVILFYHIVFVKFSVGGMKAYKWHVISFDFLNTIRNVFFSSRTQSVFFIEWNSFWIWNEDIKVYAMFQIKFKPVKFQHSSSYILYLKRRNEKKNCTQPAHVWATCSFNIRILFQNVC